jgi:hypothetical protein
MVGLIDIAPATEEVAGVKVYGVSARGIAHLLNRFPEIQKLMAGVKLDLGVDDIIKLAPDAVSAIIAAGIGKPGDPQTEEEVDRLSLEMQLDFIEAILRLTMPRGVGPFVEKLSSLGNIMNNQSSGGASTKDQGTTSRKQSKP